MISKILKLFVHIWNNQFFRFLFIGGVNTVFGYSVFALLVFCKIHYSLALLTATIIGVIFNFKTLGVIVFKNGENNKIFRFIIVYVVLYFLNLLIVSGLKNIQINLYLAGAFAILPIAITGYFLNKRFVYENIES